MTRRLLFLNGLAVLAVAIHHASGYGFQAMFEWTDRYLSVTVPDYSQVGSPAFWGIVLLQQIDNFALPAFMFVSGFFLAFMARGEKASLSWKTVFSRIKTLAIPFLIWTVAFFLLFLRRLPANLDEAFDRYYYIILLCQFYLIAPFVVPLAKRHWKLVLGFATLLELIRFGVRYLDVLGVESPYVQLLVSSTPKWLFPTLFFWFVLGLVGGFKRKELQAWLSSVKWGLVFILPLLLVLTMIEYNFIARVSGNGWLGPYFGGFSRFFYSLVFILLFLALDNSGLPLQRPVEQLGTKSLGVYLVHARTMYIAAFILYQASPRVLGNQILYQTILIIAGLAGPLLLMAAVRRSPARPFYRYLFG